MRWLIWPPSFHPICDSQRTLNQSKLPRSQDDWVPNQPQSYCNLHKNKGELRGDLLSVVAHRGTDCIIDVRVTDTDAKSNLERP
jgi:hypothetical protein